MPAHRAIHPRLPHDAHVTAYELWTYKQGLDAAYAAAVALAPKVGGRRGPAHKLLLECHIHWMVRGMGRSEAIAYVDQLTIDLDFGDQPAGKRSAGG